MSWSTRATAFTATVRNDRLLMVLHERLGVTSWELPGGHLEGGETFEQAAARETLEETGVAVDVRRLVATCAHEWPERRRRSIILFFLAEPVFDDAGLAMGEDMDVGEGMTLGDAAIREAAIRGAAWKRPDELDRDEVSPFIHPVLAEWPAVLEPGFEPLTFRAAHRQGPDGTWHPHLLGH